MTNNDELSRYMIMIEQYKEQINQLEMQSQYVQAAITDYSKAKITLENLKKTEKGKEILFPIGGGALLEATVNDTKNVLYNIGADIVIQKDVDNAVGKIQEKIESLQKSQEKINDTIQKIQLEATQISEKAQKLMSEQQTS
jgi:prefoldin alpha subunit